MPGRMIGRDGLADDVWATLLGSPSTAVVEGEPGIGKTTLFNEMIDRAVVAGWRPLVARAAQSETELSYAALGDLLSDVDDEIETLPPPMARALGSALLREDPDDDVERHAVGRAAHLVLQSLAARQPTVVLVDDAHWLDAPTESALAFSARRVGASQLRFLLTKRTDVSAGELGLERNELSIVPLHALDRLGLDRLLRERLGLRLSKPRLDELHHLSGGNPMHALEIVRNAVQQLDEPGPLVVPRELAGLLESRLGQLTRAAQQAALVVALAVEPRASEVNSLVGDGGAGLVEALRHGLIEIVRKDRVRCAHPMIASVAGQRVTPWERRDVHRRLADVADEPETRARHLALGVETPDAAVADELEAVAEGLRRRAAPEAAAVLTEAAARLTAGNEVDRRRRLRLTGEHLLAAGDSARARSIFDGLLHGLEPCAERARLLLMLSDASGDDLPVSISLAQESLSISEALDDRSLMAEAHALLEVLTWVAGDVAASARHCVVAAELAEASGDAALVASSLAELCHLQVLLGCQFDDELMTRALALESEVQIPLVNCPSFVKAMLCTFLDQPDEARALLLPTLHAVEAGGDESWRGPVQFRLAELELRSGRWNDALRHASDFLDTARQTAMSQDEALALGILGLVLAHLGEQERARDAAQRALETARRSGYEMIALRAEAVLGFLSLSCGDARSARHHLQPAQAALDSRGINELSIYHVTDNLLFALVLENDLDAASALASRVEAAGSPAGRLWHRVVGARAKAQVAAAHGSLDEALNFASEALEASRLLPQPFEQARTLLVIGEIQRRAKQRSPARASLKAALELFDALGAPLWSDKAAAQLARVAGRAASPSAKLSVTEQRVAELAALGRTNREIAADLFVSVRTVEANLTRIYAKLGVRNRSELAASHVDR